MCVLAREICLCQNFVVKALAVANNITNDEVWLTLCHTADHEDNQVGMARLVPKGIEVCSQNHHHTHTLTHSLTHNNDNQQLTNQPTNQQTNKQTSKQTKPTNQSTNQPINHNSSSKRKKHKTRLKIPLLKIKYLYSFLETDFLKNILCEEKSAGRRYVRT